jgi:hypothetical protein
LASGLADGTRSLRESSPGPQHERDAEDDDQHRLDADRDERAVAIAGDGLWGLLAEL